MAVRIPQYQPGAGPNSLGVVPVARGVHVDDSVGRGLQQLGAAGMDAAQTYMRVQKEAEAERKRQEQEDAKVYAANATATAMSATMQEFVRRQDTAEPGAPGFTQGMNDWMSEYEETVVSQAPNDTSKKFIRESMLRLRVDTTQSALSFESSERRKWRVDTAGQAIDSAASAMAADPARLPTVLAEQRALIDSYDIPQEAKRALQQQATEKIAMGAVLGEVKRNPAAAQAKLAARLGMDPMDVDGPRVGATAPTDGQEVNAKYDAIGSSFGFRVTSTTRTVEENTAVGGVPNSQHLEGVGTARDWSIKGKSPDEVAAFVRALRAEGFEASVHTKGTAPHVHAELPPQRQRKSIEQATAEKPKGDSTGSMAYDLLPVPTVVSLLGTVSAEIDKQNSQYRSIVAQREADDLAAFGDGKQPPAPLTAGEFVTAYGGVEGARRWKAYKSAQGFATEMAGLTTKTPAEIAATVQARAPQPGDGYAAASQQHATLVQAARTVLTQRAEDPVAFAEGAGLADVQDLNFQDMNAFGAELKSRVGVAQTMSGKYGTRYTLLTNAEAAQMSATMGKMTAPEKAVFLQTVRSSLPDPVAYQSIMSQLRPDSPVTATAGSIMAVGGQVKVGRDGMFSNAPSIDATQVAQKVLIGEDLLNPAKGDKAADGKPKFPMPNEGELRGAWTDYVSTAYAGSPETESASYQAFRAFYAAEVAQSGNYSGEFDEDAAKRAAAAVTGGVVDVNDSPIVLPWGVNEGDTLGQLRRGWEEQSAAAGLTGVPFESISLQTVGDGLYAVTAGVGPVRGRDGKPMVLRVKRGIPEAPASSYTYGGAHK